jgi:gamma-glutamyl hercynylcysteine S-oxide synthase
MHTTGLPEETIGRLYEGERLSHALADARARTLAIYAHLDLDALTVPKLAIVNPPVWELAHIAWFQEFWCLRDAGPEGVPKESSILEDADRFFNSGTVPHGTRWSLPYPPLRELRQYMEATLEATQAKLSRTAEGDRYYFALCLLHEDMHAEALLMTLQTLGLPHPEIGAEPPASLASAARDIEFRGGEFQLGTSRDYDGFVFDNEKWAHACKVGPFRMASRVVSQGEYMAFVADDGYEREELWTPEGLEWVVSSRRFAPHYWREHGKGWQMRRFERWQGIDPHAPMVHVSLHEAEAFCRWAGRRLPSEAEWEYAARNGGEEDRFPWGDEPLEPANLDYRYRAPFAASTESAASRSGLRQMLGGVWEWTSSAFRPYPGFHADPYKDYSEPWFESHYVLRGGCMATRSRLVHNRLRNFYLPHRDDIFAGFRTCAAE